MKARFGKLGLGVKRIGAGGWGLQWFQKFLKERISYIAWFHLNAIDLAPIADKMICYEQHPIMGRLELRIEAGSV